MGLDLVGLRLPLVDDGWLPTVLDARSGRDGMIEVCGGTHHWSRGRQDVQGGRQVAASSSVGAGG